MELVGQSDRVHRVDVLRPVDARLRIPLLVLSLLVQGKEPGASLVVLPREARVAGAGDLPRVRRGHFRVLVPRGHELPPLRLCASDVSAATWLGPLWESQCSALGSVRPFAAAMKVSRGTAAYAGSPLLDSQWLPAVTGGRGEAGNPAQDPRCAWPITSTARSGTCSFKRLPTIS